MTLLQVTPCAAQQGTPEFRALWVDTWHEGILSPDQTTELVNTAADANYNAIIVEVRKNGDAYYLSAYEPWATNIAEPGYDPLADLIAKAHARGIEVHAWLVTYRIWHYDRVARPAPSNHVITLHPEWAMANSSGSTKDGSYVNLDPGVPGVQQYICDVVKDIVTKYNVDGINFDYIRYPGTSWGYNDLVRERFRQEYGSYPPTSTIDPKWSLWCDYRRKQVTDLVRKCYVEVMAIRPSVKMSADTIGWLGADPNVDFTKTRAYTDVFQNHKGWLQEHILDMNILMNYKREYDSAQAADYRLWTDFLAKNKFGRHTIVGPAVYLNSIADSMTQMLYARTAGVDGIATYSYAATNKDGQPNSDFYNAVKTTVFTSPAPVPDMPWKSNPTTGIIFGQTFDASMPNHPIYQNWVYRASVLLSGRGITKTVYTDATGTYAFMDLAPGEYTIAAHGPGFTRQIRTVRVTAGSVNRVNFYLSAREPVSAGKAATLPDGTQVMLVGKVVTVPSGKFPECIYVEEPDRSSGIQVRFADTVTGLENGDVLNLTGVMATIDGERVVSNAVILDKQTGVPLDALATSVRDLSRTPSSIGLLMQVAGQVTSRSSGRFTLSDETDSVEVLCPGMVTPAVGSVVRVTGISTLTAPENGSAAAIRVREQSDIEATPPTVQLTAPAVIRQIGWNQVGIPCTPVNPLPSAIFSGINIESNLFRWDGAYYIRYNAANAGEFGGMQRGMGAWLKLTQTGSFGYEGLSDSGACDMRISLPKRGWYMISQPFTTATACSDLLMTDGTQTKTMDQAVQSHWVKSVAYWWNNAADSYQLTSLTASSSGSLQPWRGYWIRTYVDDLALIIPQSGAQAY